MKKIVYYAHQLSLYNTPQEKRDIDLLESLGFEVYNPNNPEVQEQCKQGGDYFDKIFVPLVNKADALAFRANSDLKIGAGVYKEIKIAQNCNIPIIELPSGILERELTVEQTRGRLAELGQR